MKIGILGGTFDPVHQGHLALARAAKQQFALSKVFFIPAFLPPHKTERRDLAPAPHRYRMVELAIRGEPDFEISDIEFSRPGVSYTVDTLRAFKKLHPADDLFLILGADTLAELSDWREPGEIRRLVTFLAAPRPGIRLSEMIKSGNVCGIEMPECVVSSSQIREIFREGASPGENLLPSAVEASIRRLKLYGT